jgi:hypothetical protein
MVPREMWIASSLRFSQSNDGVSVFVGWAKRSVPTILRSVNEEWWARRKLAFAHPTNFVSRASTPYFLVDGKDVDGRDKPGP